MTGAGAREAAAGPATLLNRVQQVTSIVAPTTLVGSLLFYFGYVATRSRFLYFGVHLDMTNLSTQSLLLLGLEVVFVPAAVAMLAVLVVLVVHGGISWLISSGIPRPFQLLIAMAVGLTGVLVVARAVVGIFVPHVAEAEVLGITALALAVGPALVGYGIHIAGRPNSDQPDRFVRWYADRQPSKLRRAAVVCIVGLGVAGLFWAANQFASAYGTGRAYEDALELVNQPEVVLDTKTRLFDVPPGVNESISPATADDAIFRYRYRGFRLLLAADGRLYLVPGQWTGQSRTVVVPYDSDIRVQLAPNDST